MNHEAAPRRLAVADELALDRTHLANERTLLAYLRSGMALFIAGITIIHFSEAGWFALAGVACIPGGIVFATVGIARFRAMGRRIRRRGAGPRPLNPK